jgi:hypothetical protein
MLDSGWKDFHPDSCQIRAGTKKIKKRKTESAGFSEYSFLKNE